MAISKRMRFSVFKRDKFTCAYCGRTPPEVVLEVDHIIPVCSGGPDVIHNLATACFDCNRGKSGESLTVIPQDLTEQIRIASEKAEQIKRFDAMLRNERKRNDAIVHKLAGYWCDLRLPTNEAGTRILNDEWQRSIKKFIERLTPAEIEGAMEKAQNMDRADERRRLKYFCGICWNMIKRKGQQNA